MNTLPEIDLSIVDAWIKIQHTQDAEGLWWAWDKVSEWTCKEPDNALSFILKVLETDSSKKIIENLSAGPLEDLLCNFGPYIIDAVEIEANSNPKFANLLGGIWQSSITEAVWTRIQSVWDRSNWDGIQE